MKAFTDPKRPSAKHLEKGEKMASLKIFRAEP